MATRRSFLKWSAAAGLAPAVASAQGAGRVVVVGGGFAGATAARTLKKLEPTLAVTLVEPDRIFTACPSATACWRRSARSTSSSSAMTASRAPG